MAPRQDTGVLPEHESWPSGAPMRTDSGDCGNHMPAEGRTGKRWQDVVLAAQQDLADTLGDAIGDGRLDRHTYQHWLATESVICRLNALALDAVADWHVSLPQLRAVAHAWATTTRDDALVAAADVRGFDGMAPALPPQLVPWQAFLESAARSSRAGEALGAVVLHGELMRGPMRHATASVMELRFVPVRGSRYLLLRGQSPTAAELRERGALLDAYSGTALAAGAMRAAAWHRDALASVLAAGGRTAFNAPGFGRARGYLPIASGT